MPLDTSIKSVLIIGSGPIVIGQACEFDYSGTQATRSLREEGIEVILINSNPATIMTDPLMADHVYLLPLDTNSLETILQNHKIDAVLPTMGGQTALNLTKEAERIGLWEKYNIRIIGVDIHAIDRTEDRDQFKSLMKEIGIPVPRSFLAASFLEGKEAAQAIGIPLVIRPSFTLGGSGGGFIRSAEALEPALQHALKTSPIHEVLIEEAVIGWKEYELEVLRDALDNIVVICTIENVDPMGVHTGDSITVAPALTLSDTAYQRMRDYAILMMKSIGTFSGGCNVQFAMNPADEEIVAVEINPRVSRSSALASKATGYPIAKISAKLAIGYTLDELINPVTKSTSAFFEPTIDYVIVKIPRWNFDKFPGADTSLGLQMKSVGEVMAIGRSFTEALQKACCSLELKRAGLGADGHAEHNLEKITKSLEFPSWDRIFHVKDAMSLGVPLNTIFKLTKIDRWYLLQIQKLVHLENELRRYSLHNLPHDYLLTLKQNGFSDIQIAWILGVTEEQVFQKRMEMGVRRSYKMVDTCAAEFGSTTNYFYGTFEEFSESVSSDREKVIILGSGPNRIGQGIEFDYCCVHGILASKECGYEAIMVNCNPETVSTDFDISDKLYFEPVFWENLREIVALEKPKGVIVQLGGQTALKLAQKLHEFGIPILGTSFENMDLAEDRGSFSDLLKELEIPYPEYGVATSADEAIALANTIGYPVLVRPSYVLGGQGMKIVINDAELESAVLNLLRDIPNNRILIDHFLDRADEAEVDSISDGTDVMIMGIMEHIEPAGIHSGDSHAILPSFSFPQHVVDTMVEYTTKIAKALNIKGLMNVQFAVKNEKVYVIEANPRASRSMPFICKTYQAPFLNIATKVILDQVKLADVKWENNFQGYAIKVPVFSFDKFTGISKELGPEMKSTGEAIYFIKDTNDPYFRSLYNEKSMYLSK